MQKNRFEKFARIFSRQHKQTTFSDVVFLGALRVNKKLNTHNWWSLILLLSYSIAIVGLKIKHTLLGGGNMYLTMLLAQQIHILSSLIKAFSINNIFYSIKHNSI